MKLTKVSLGPKAVISKDLPVKLQEKIAKYKFPEKGVKTITFAPHYSPAGEMDCVLANYGAYTRTMPLNAKDEDVLITVADLIQGKPMFNRIG